MESRLFSDEKNCNVLFFSLEKYCNARPGVLIYLKGGIILKNRWSELLGIERSTLWRWEQEIIAKKGGVAGQFWRQRKNKHGYDPYQRFITLIIYALKFPVGMPGKDNQEIIDYFGETYLDVPIWKHLARDKFEQIIRSEEL